METIKTLDVETRRGRAEIRLVWGNLMDVGADEPIDILVVSTFTNDYTPTPTSLVGQLFFRGVDLRELARDKAMDLGARFGGWLSHDIAPLRSGVRARQVLCIEGANPQRLFRSLVAVLSDHSHTVRVAMPVIGTGDQGYRFANVFPAILEAAVEWILLGLPVSRLEIVIPNKKRAGEAAVLFEHFAKDRVVSAVRLCGPQEGEPTSETHDGRTCKSGDERAAEYDYDLFLSYAHDDARPADALLAALQDRKVRVFQDRTDLVPGTIWQHQILSELDNCQRIAALLSQNYLESNMCIEEFNIAKIRQRDEDRVILAPIYWCTTKLPTYMKLHQWIDCREADEARIDSAAARLAELCHS